MAVSCLPASSSGWGQWSPQADDVLDPTLAFASMSMTHGLSGYGLAAIVALKVANNAFCLLCLAPECGA